MTLPFWLIVPFIIISSFFSTDAGGPSWKSLVVSILVLIPGIIMLVAKHKWAWRAVSSLSSYKNFKGLQHSLELRSMELLSKNAPVILPEVTDGKESNNILLFQSLVDTKMTEVIDSLQKIVLRLDSPVECIEEPAKVGLFSKMPEAGKKRRGGKIPDLDPRVGS